MPLSCPLCRAANEQGPNCRRCRADLSLLFALEDQRAALLTSARGALAQGRLDAALQDTRQADQLRHGADIERLVAAVALLRRDFPAAWSAHQRARPSSGG